VPSDIFTPMASSLAFAPGNHVRFDTIDFLSIATGALCLAYPDEPVNVSRMPEHSIGNEAEKQSLGQSTTTIKRQAGEASPPAPKFVGNKLKGN
jgi:hypothetical protein